MDQETIDRSLLEALATVHPVSKALDAAACEAALSGWAGATLGDPVSRIAIDGKALR